MSVKAFLIPLTFPINAYNFGVSNEDNSFFTYTIFAVVSLKLASKLLKFRSAPVIPLNCVAILCIKLEACSKLFFNLLI